MSSQNTSENMVDLKQLKYSVNSDTERMTKIGKEVENKSIDAFTNCLWFSVCAMFVTDIESYKDF